MFRFPYLRLFLHVGGFCNYYIAENKITYEVKKLLLLLRGLFHLVDVFVFVAIAHAETLEQHWFGPAGWPDLFRCHPRLSLLQNRKNLGEDSDFYFGSSLLPLQVNSKSRNFHQTAKPRPKTAAKRGRRRVTCNLVKTSQTDNWHLISDADTAGATDITAIARWYWWYCW